MPASVAQALKAAGIPTSAAGIVVQRMDESRPCLSVNAEQALNPASTIKLQFTVDIIDRAYETGSKTVLNLKASLRVITDAKLPAWNYTVTPNSTA